MHTSTLHRFIPAALLLAAALPACATSDEPEPAPPLATLAGSELAAAIGVTTWEVRTEGDGARVIGRGEDGARNAELVVRPDATTADRVHAESVFPERGTFDLARGGAVGGAPSAFLGKLAAAVNADLGEHPVAITPALDGTATSAISTQNEGIFAVGWSFFPHSNNILVGVECPGLVRHHASASSLSGAATCTDNGWLNSQTDDCRVYIYYSIGGFSTDTCRWSVHVD